MNTKLFLFIALRIFFLTNLLLLIAYLPNQLRDFFGDTKASDYAFGFFDNEWNWGFLHYIYFMNTSILFILLFINILSNIEKEVKKYK